MTTAPSKDPLDIAAAAGRDTEAVPEPHDVAGRVRGPTFACCLLGRQFPQVTTMLLDAAGGITAFADFPPDPLEEDLEHQPAGTAEPR